VLSSSSWLWTVSRRITRWPRPRPRSRRRHDHRATGTPLCWTQLLGAWYRDCLGLDADQNGLWHQGAGLTVFATFESETDYFGSRAQQAMLNFRVRDLDTMLAQLRDNGANVAHETQDMEGVGRFGWVTDPEGNRIELWQPV
jgi:catechol 2,3-dioxygenase-like lactoylglutathione lyase family enzyme